jgi:hypothetical protein
MSSLLLLLRGAGEEPKPAYFPPCEGARSAEREAFSAPFVAKYASFLVFCDSGPKPCGVLRPEPEVGVGISPTAAFFAGGSFLVAPGTYSRSSTLHVFPLFAGFAVVALCDGAALKVARDHFVGGVFVEEGLVGRVAAERHATDFGEFECVHGYGADEGDVYAERAVDAGAGEAEEDAEFGRGLLWERVSLRLFGLALLLARWPGRVAVCLIENSQLC